MKSLLAVMSVYAALMVLAVNPKVAYQFTFITPPINHTSNTAVLFLKKLVSKQLLNSLLRDNYQSEE